MLLQNYYNRFTPVRTLRARAFVRVDSDQGAEVKILQVLHDSRGQALSRDHLFRACWGGDHYPNTRTLEQHVSQLRKKIERDPKEPTIIETVRGVGYRFDG